MPEAEPEPDLPPPMRRTVVVWFFGGFFVAGLVGTVFALVAGLANAPIWVLPFAFIGPPAAFVLTFALIFIPKAIRYASEAVRNAPSPESVAAIAEGKGVEAGTKPTLTPDDEPDKFPTVDEVFTQPGKVLPHSLAKAGIPPGCQLGCIAIFAVLWNSVVSTFLFQTIADWNRGKPIQWGGLLFLSPFVLIGLVLIGACFYLAYRVFVSLLVGRIEVEVSDHPIVIGSTVRLHIAQVGMVPLNRVKVSLVCTEEATYVAGTNQSTAKREVQTEPISRPDEDANRGNLPLAAEFAVPTDAMHTFSAPNNKINWTIRVSGRTLGLLPYSGDFSVTVSPG